MRDKPHDGVTVAGTTATDLAEDDFDLDLRISVAPLTADTDRDGYTTYTTCHASCAGVVDQIRRDEPRMDGYTTYTTCHCC